MLGPTTVDLPGGDEHKTHWLTGVTELKRAVVVSELIAIWVSNGDVLEEGEVNSAVSNGESGEPNGVDGDFRRFGFEEEEISNDNGCNKQDEEHSGTNT